MAEAISLPRPPRSVRLLCRAARWAWRRSAVHAPTDLERTTEDSKYRAWRSRELEQQLTHHFDAGAVTNRDVLDFGCGTGELCALLAAYKPKSLCGVDQSYEAINRAETTGLALDVSLACRPKFICTARQDRLPLDDETTDLICCFDVVEHIPDVRAAAEEWRRVLRADGRVWIWWSPWRGPHGHHLESLLPLPWVHLFLSERTIFHACAELYDDAAFIPRKWDRDPETGRKKPNKWRHTSRFRPFLNRLTRRRFERAIRQVGLTVTRRETHGFSGSRVRRATRLFLPIPVLGDGFVSFYIYELGRA